MAARVASSILIAAGLAYMVVRDSSEYEAFAARLLLHPPALARWQALESPHIVGSFASKVGLF